VQDTMLLVFTWTSLAVGIASSAAIVVDNLILGYRQPVKVMEFVWWVSAFYVGAGAVAAYWKWGRPQSHRWRQRHGHPPRRPRWATSLIIIFHGGTHCALGTIIAGTAIFAVGIDTAGGKRWVEYVFGYAMAVTTGVVFQYFEAAQRGRRNVRAATVNFARGHLASVSAFELTLFVWLTLADRFLFPAASRPSSPVYWFLIQIGLISGLLAASALWLAVHRDKVEPPDALE
jgi:Domain of unknown function (DUF4396)